MQDPFGNFEQGETKIEKKDKAKGRESPVYMYTLRQNRRAVDAFVRKQDAQLSNPAIKKAFEICCEGKNYLNLTAFVKFAGQAGLFP